MSEMPPGWVESTLADLIATDGVLRDGDWVESKDQDPEGNVRPYATRGRWRRGIPPIVRNRFLRDDQADLP